MQIHTYVSLSDITYYHIGGEARYVLQVASSQDILQAMSYLRQHKIHKYYCLGLGSNVIFPDTGFSGAIILFVPPTQQPRQIETSKIEAFAGLSMDTLIQCSFQHSLAGLGWAGGLPSTVGGAVRGNAGAFGSEIQQSVEQVSYIDSSASALVLQTLQKNECHFAYRDSLFKQHPEYIISSVTFALSSATPEQLKKEQDTYQANIAYRQSHHPMDYPSCGSIFKNIVKKEEVEKIIALWPDVKEMVEQKWYGKVSMAYLIGRLGFSGYRVGGAQVSKKHNNYISNIADAKASDVIEIIETIKQTFLKKFGFVPELEVAIVDEKYESGIKQ